MKTIPPPCPEPETGRQYWRSLDQLADTPEFRQWLEREFPTGASEFTDPVSRRHFVKIMSASFLLAGVGLTGCRRPVERILPFGKAPENYVHGVPQYYATAMPTRGSAIPLVVKSNDGRPTKIEGNPEHPDSNGGTDAFAQASILNLYDPDRAKRFAKDGNNVTREAAVDFLGEIAKKAQGNGGQGLRFLTERSSSPSRARLQKQITEKYPEARWHIYEPVDFDVHRRAASISFGRSLSPYVKLDAAKVVVSLDCDFIGSEEDSYLHCRRFARGRRLVNPEDSMNRLYSVEALLTLTGSNADHRLRIEASLIPAVAARLAQEILKQGGNEISGPVQQLGEAAKAHEKWIVECAKDLVAAGDQGVVLAGYRQPLAVHLLANAINSALGSIGRVVLLREAPEPTEGNLAELANALYHGQVETLVILGGNPVYNAPADLKWAQAQANAGTVIRLGYYEDESFPAKGWQLPLAHYLESWGDARTADGTVVPVQPLIAPLFDGITELEVLARIGGIELTKPHDLVRQTVQELGANDENAWRKFLHDGFLAGTQAKPVQVNDTMAISTLKLISMLNTLPVSVQINGSPVALGQIQPASPNNLEIVFARAYSVDDGRFNNNGWLQEIPDPITRLTWENAILISPATSEALGLGGVQTADKGMFHNPWVKITAGGATLEGPVWVVPGMADNTLGLALGYGREQTGRIGRLQDGTPAGFNAYKLRTAAAEHLATGARLEKTGRNYMLACTQEHGAMEGRPIVREANLEQYRKHPKFTHNMDMHEPVGAAPMYPNPLDEFKGKAHHQWGMSIDLTTCVGCNACVVACQSENNVPIVGKDQVARGREMHWLRIDRYFAGPVADPQLVFQPMLCQHCEAAPCENVCPVNATVHDEEGLNLMVYNRCVGTRYCSNNCPYKIRRFNFFDYNKRPLHELYKTPMFSRTDGEWELKRFFKNPDKGSKAEDEWDLMKLVRNPDVSVRMRGVMEKCTFCVQRIEQAKIARKVKAGASGDVEVPDGTIQTACEQACPAEAIVFGNVADPESRVSKLKQQQRDYSVLEFLATKPRLTYLAQLRNPNPNMPDYYDMPQTTQEYSAKNRSPFESHHGGHESKAGKGAH